METETVRFFLAPDIKISEMSRVMDLRNPFLYSTMRISGRMVSGPQAPNKKKEKRKSLQLQLFLAKMRIDRSRDKI